MDSLLVELGLLILGGIGFAFMIFIMRTYLLDKDAEPLKSQTFSLPNENLMFAGEEIEIPTISETKLKHQQNLKLAKTAPKRVETTIKKWLHEEENQEMEMDHAGTA